MWMRKLFDDLNLWLSRRRVQKAQPKEPRRRSAAGRLAVEALEDRSVPALLAIGDLTVMEGRSGTQNAAVVVSLSEPSNKTVTVTP